jgi:hypothetical protein
MNKLKVFISSRVNSTFDKLDGGFSLEDLRKYIKDELEEAKFFDQQMLDVVINELSFDVSISKDAFDTCMTKMRECNIIIILFNREAGWSVSENDSTNGMCHEEFLIAMNEFSDMTFAMDISSFFTLPENGDEYAKNELFKKDVTDSFIHKVNIKAKSIKELKENVLKQAKQYVLESVEKSFRTQKRIIAGSTTFGATLDWSKLSYSERQSELKKKLQESFESLSVFQHIIKAFHAIPDNMSVSDARNSIGRPFINEHNFLIDNTKNSGVIHFVGVYGNSTEMQVKNLVGYPDLAVIKAPFGFYLWEKNMHIQMFFLKNCINPQTVKTRLSEVITWLRSSREQAKIIARANARFSILDAVNKVKDTK